VLSKARSARDTRRSGAIGAPQALPTPRPRRGWWSNDPADTFDAPSDVTGIVVVAAAVLRSSRKTMTAERILIVDDEPDLQRLVLFNLREAGFEVEAVGTGKEVVTKAHAFDPQVVILDLMLPDIPGTEVCRQLRSEPALADVAILMLTARADEYDRVLGFEVGADDYVVKPFSVRELVMRVKGMARRFQERRSARAISQSQGHPIFKWRGLELDPVRHRIFLDGAEASLRPLEFKLITIFLEHPGRMFTRAELLEEVWGVSGDMSTRTVDTHVRRLRERLGSYGEAVQTLHGFGYRLRDP
jgi:two-component system phosphate regulon response regulator PhoB